MANLSFVMYGHLLLTLFFSVLWLIFLKKTFKNMAKNRNEKFF